jgi:hypothetical protein
MSVEGACVCFIKVGINGLIRDFLKIHLKKSHVLVSAKKKSLRLRNNQNMVLRDGIRSVNL